MISISEILRKFQVKSVEGLDSINSFTDTIFKITGIKIDSKNIRLHNKKIVLDRSIPSTVKNVIVLKKDLILKEIKNKNTSSNIEDVG